MSVLCCACTPLHLNQTELKVRELLEDRWRRRNHAWEWDITNACQSSSSALLDACSLTFLIVQDKFQLHTLEAFFFFWIWCSYFSLCFCMLNVTHTLLRLANTHAFSGQCFSEGRKGGMAAEDKCIFHYYRFSPLLRWQWEQPLLKHLFSAPRRFPCAWTPAKQKSNLNITGN